MTLEVNFVTDNYSNSRLLFFQYSNGNRWFHTGFVA